MKKVLFYQDNAPSHTLPTTMAILNEVGFDLVPHFPERNSLRLFLCFNIKIWRGGTGFSTIEAVIEAVNKYLAGFGITYFFGQAENIENSLNQVYSSRQR